ncbi:MAG: HNH endonuclease [Oscillospiraceae bacterium]
MICQEKFEEYLYNIVSENSAHKYANAINSISNDMINVSLISCNLYSYSDINTLFCDISKIFNNDVFNQKDKKGHKMYSCALNHLRNYCEENIKKDNLLPEEIPENQLEHLKEGSTKTVLVNAFERNPKARAECIKEYGSQCSICGFDFGKFYGSQFNGKIHVHHIKPLNEIREEYEVNPKIDLIPVCANCHVILHSKYNGTYTKEEVKKFIEDSKLLK